MRRRSVVRQAGLAGVFATLSAPAVHAQPVVRWRIVTTCNPLLDAVTAGVELFVRELGLLSGGRFQVSVQAGDEWASPASLLEALQQGEIDALHGVPAQFVGIDEVFALDGAIPFGLNSRQMTAWQLEGNGLKLMREFFAAHQMVNFPMGNSGAQMGGWFRRELHTLSDLKGLRMQLGGLAARVLHSLGGVPQQLPAGELVAALERGAIDAAEWIGPHDDRKLGLSRVARNYYYPGWWEGGSQLSLYCGSKSMRALSAEHRAAVEAAASRAHMAIQARYDVLNSQAIKQLVAAGTRVKPFPPAFIDAAFKASMALYAELGQRNPGWRRVYADYASFRREQNLWYRLAEASFDRYMQSARL
ncbi:MAG: hypothetical protein RJA36_1376 [Pseudomonadota bacterium]|jgi:TRAP-type mannitol/chloroaromatic compound transport system substrate-binding protein